MRVLARFAFMVPLAGAACFAQGSLGAQRSPDGSWVPSGVGVAGLYLELGEAGSVGLGAGGGLTGLSSNQGSFDVVTQPVVATAHVRLLGRDRKRLAAVAELAPVGSVDYTPPGGSSPVREGHSMHAMLGAAYEYRGRVAENKPERGTWMFFGTLGLQSFRASAPADVVYGVGPSAGVGIALSAGALWRMFDCLSSKKGCEEE